MKARAQMLSEMGRHRVAIPRDQDTLRAFGPLQELRILGAKRQVLVVADAYDIQRILSRTVVPLDRSPEWAAQVLVQNVTDRHGSPHSPPAPFHPSGAT